MAATPDQGARALRIAVLADRPADIERLAVSYQWAQLIHLEAYAQVIWGAQAWAAAATTEGRRELDAMIVFDESSLLIDERIRALPDELETLLVFVTHDFWAHPLHVAQFLVPRRRRVLMVLRHHSSQALFARIAPEIEQVYQRPGVETSIFHPRGEKQFDVLLSGSETPDYPIRQKVNRVVREHADRLGWNLLDLTAVGLISNPRSDQLAYAPALAAAKVSPTGTNRGALGPARLVLQYFDQSPVRPRIEESSALLSPEHLDFYGVGRPDLMVQELATGGITPRYLESFASGTFLIGDIPPEDPQEFYRPFMGVVTLETPDEGIAALVDQWVRDDAAREDVCARALAAVEDGETSRQRAAELAELIHARV
jgi:hypothetical protein